jgi:peptidase C39-like protein
LPTIPPGGGPEPQACRLRLSRRRLLGAGSALLLASALPPRAQAAQDSRLVYSPDAVDSASYPVDALSLDWPPVPPPSSIVEVPYRSQLDGSPQARANCGPASLAMLFARFDDGTSIADIRYSVNRFMGIWWVDNGSTWEALANAAETRGYQVIGLYEKPGKRRRWTVDDLVAQTEQGLPVMILTYYRALPGHAGSYFRYNHYIVIVGVDRVDGSIVYHDPAYLDSETGSYLRMTREQLDAAWSSVSSGIDYSGMAIKPRKK